MAANDGSRPARLLETITCPADLKKLSREELLQVTTELRQAIIQNISKTGGHFASNLGTVELTVAMYASYDFPPDKFVWDTGHQAYPHKMLTGRLDRFPTLRQYKGLSGFLRLEESEFDHWGAGHACTALSAALGYAVARDRRGTDERVVAIIGDATLTGGMAWEALNNAGEMRTDLTVILNDNKMSIAENVGAFTTYLAKLRARPWYQQLHEQAKQAVEKLPKSLSKTAAGLHHGVTHFVAPDDTGAIFEEMGFTYIGPIDGHDIDVLMDVFTNAKALRKPVIIHAITVKGKGYDFAESDARTWHGVTPFGIDEGKIEKKAAGIAYTAAFADALIEEAGKDEKILAITAAMPDGTGLSKFKKSFPERFYDVGIAEQHAVTFAAGLAAGGFKPFVAIYSTFMQRAFDLILHDVCLQNLPVRFMLDRAGLVGEDGATHHGVYDLSYLNLIPNLVIAAPRDTEELAMMVRFAAGFEAPIAVRYPRGSTPNVDWDRDHAPVELGKAETIAEGDDVSFIAIGSMVAPAWVASEALRKRGIEAAVINARFMKPLDVDTLLAEARRTKRLVLVEENAVEGGFGQSVMAALMKHGVTDVQVKHLAVPDRFVEHGSMKELHEECGLTSAAMVKAALELVMGEAAVNSETPARR